MAWILGIAFVVVVVLITLVARGAAAPAGAPLSPTNPAPPGSMAVAEVLKQHGVKVVPAGTLATARSALKTADSTLLVFDPDGYLDTTRLEELAALSDTVVLVTPDFSQLQAVAPAIGQAGAAKETTLTAGCELPAADRAGSISGGGQGYRVIDATADATACFGTGKGIHSLVEVREGERTVTVLGASQVLSNETVAMKGNASLALNLLGSASTLVWYLPSVDDVAVTGQPTIAQLTPPWVSPVALLCLCIAIAAAFWKGRRMGPLVIENLPVTVRASETMEGRARLYQKGSARLHALDALRIGSVERLGRLCGLPGTASTAEVVAAASAVIGRDRMQLAGILVDAVPANDRDLIRVSDALLEIEKAVAHAIAG